MQKSYIFLLTTVVVIYAILISSIGFLSDDYDLLSRSRQQHFLHPLETHHYSLLLNSLFRLNSDELLHPQMFHLVALVFHLFNVLLVAFFTHHIMSFSQAVTFPVALLFAINLPGIEALTWCCALPYTVTAAFTLLSMIIYGSYLKNKESLHSSSTTLALSILFILGALTWEWIVLVIPILFTLMFLQETERTAGEKILPLLPLVVIALAVSSLRKFVGLSPGYEMNKPLQMAGIFLSSPFIGLFPFFPKAFYSSPMGILSELSFFLLFLWMGRNDRRLRLLLAIFLICQLPNTLLGHPQSRYFYFASFPLYAYSVFLISKARKFRLLVTLSYAASLFLAISRIHTWQRASTVSLEMKEAMVALIEKNQGPVAVLDLPKAYGPEEQIWRPHLWRCGLEAFGGYLKVGIPSEQNLPIYQFSWINSGDSFQFQEIVP